jgi:hypothetical protein
MSSVATPRDVSPHSDQEEGRRRLAVPTSAPGDATSGQAWPPPRQPVRQVRIGSPLVSEPFGYNVGEAMRDFDDKHPHAVAPARAPSASGRSTTT